MNELHYKDEGLDQLSRSGNVAQFVSFDPSVTQRFSRVIGYEPNFRFESLRVAVDALLRSPEGAVNVRSFAPDSPKGRDFFYGLSGADAVIDKITQLSNAGLHTIINETVEVTDGGVSGVIFGDLIEFAPGDTPRCVEKPGTTALQRSQGLRFLETVYSFRPALDYPLTSRVEFSLHPLRRGYNNEHTILWEMQDDDPAGMQQELNWPNRFSRFIGDKAFGLMIADLLGMNVPRTTVISRGIAPFSFGRPTGTGEMWIRTCPIEQVPGKFTTQHGWMDPFQLLAVEDPEGTAIASVLAQEGVEARYSGALIVGIGERPIIEGVSGMGEEFMLGQAKGKLPAEVVAAVTVIHDSLKTQLGPVRFEWVYDGAKVWVVQLHRGMTLSSEGVICPGDPARFHDFAVENGLEKLRELIEKVLTTHEGIILIGDVGVTSHFGDVLRKAKIPSRIQSRTLGTLAV